jgi:hypothetical protein
MGLPRIRSSTGKADDTGFWSDAARQMLHLKAPAKTFAQTLAQTSVFPAMCPLLLTAYAVRRETPLGVRPLRPPATVHEKASLSAGPLWPTTCPVSDRATTVLLTDPPSVPSPASSPARGPEDGVRRTVGRLSRRGRANGAAAQHEHRGTTSDERQRRGHGLSDRLGQIHTRRSPRQGRTRAKLTELLDAAVTLANR